MSAEILSSVLGLLALLSLAPSASAQPVGPGAGGPVASTEDRMREGLGAFNDGARFPLPSLAPSQIDRLVQGKVLKLREVGDSADEPQRAIGLLRVHEAAAALWLAVRDVHFTAVDELVEVRLTPPGQWPSVWYQHLDLPRPFSDRHWVVDVEDSHALAEASGGRCWEHSWELAADGVSIADEAVRAGTVPGIDSERAAAAIYTPVNRGAWLVIDLGDGTTLLGYHVTSVIGGAVPDKLVADYTLFTLGKLLKGVAGRTAEVVQHYNAEHAPIEGGDGVPLAPRLGRP